ncbi:hypothetical protein SBADM41S_02302 [Streptomyces badius]
MTGDEAVRDGVRAGERAARRLAELGVCKLEPGLDDAEFDRIETECGIAFAADHRGFLAAGLPVGRAAPPEEGESPRNPLRAHVRGGGADPSSGPGPPPLGAYAGVRHMIRYAR